MDSVLPKNRIDLKDSLHATQRQSSQYVKIEDNIMNFNFDRIKNMSSSRTKLSDSDMKKLGKDMNRINLAFLSSAEVRLRRKEHLNKLQFFM